MQGLLAMFVYEGNLGSGAKALPNILRSFDVYRALNETDSPRRDETDEAQLENERQAVSWCMWGFCCGRMVKTPNLGLFLSNADGQLKARIAGAGVQETGAEAKGWQGMAGARVSPLAA